jgi:LuxR family transcriptional regulator, glucitol operon activator
MNGVSAVRNTCFAVLSSVETDLREILADIALKENASPILPPDVQKNAAQRFEQDVKHRPGIIPDDLDLLEYTDFADLSKMLHVRAQAVSELAGKDILPIAEQIETLTPARNRVCHSRPLEDDDLPRFLDLAKMLLQTFPALGWRELKRVTEAMQSDPSYVFRLTIPGFWRVGDDPISHNLPLPDFDETGFLGRTTDKRELTKHLLGPHPVISLVGEGGVGKTALAVHCLYKLLDISRTDPLFDAIVWVSLKTKVLTSAGIQEIRDAVASNLGLVQATASALGSPIASTTTDADQLLAEIRDYLDRLRILLVIDNYETLASDELRPFLRSVPKNSKILITARIGLGEVEVRYKLDPLDRKTAASLLRRYAGSLNLKILVSAPDKKLEHYCSLLYDNPLLIKWFVSSVAGGSDPDAIASRSSEGFSAALRFCFENLFNRLSTVETTILHTLASARRQLTQAELQFILEDAISLKQEDIGPTVATLHNSSMLKRSISDTRRPDSTVQIALTDVAADYIARFAPPPRKLFEATQSTLKKLRGITEQSAVKQEIYKYDIFTVRATSIDERISGAFLHSALAHLRNGKVNEAQELVDKARVVLPGFSEVYRIGAIVYSKAGDLYKASQELETAINLAPRAALPRYQYALFQLHDLDDSQNALLQIDTALTLDPGDETLETARALCLVRLGKCKEAAEIYEHVLTNLNERPRKWRIPTRDQAAECYRRWAEQDRALRDTEAARIHLERATTLLNEALANNDYDRRTPSLYSNIVEDALFVAMSSSDSNYATDLLTSLADASALLTFPPFKKLTLEHFSAFFSGNDTIIELARRLAEHDRTIWHEGPPILVSDSDIAETTGETRQGIIKIIPPAVSYGFIADDSGKEWFFHRNHLVKKEAWDSLISGQRVKFKIGRNAQGECAVRIETTTPR